jgi:RimJ/RimL family protein N-acetyltransferase
VTGPRGTGVHIAPWSAEEGALLERLLSDPRMTQHFGGPESAEKIAERQARYERAGSRQYKIVDEASGDAVGWVGYWERTWRGGEVFETGWSVLPAYQGRGIAGSATAQLIEIIRSERRHRFLHAYPSVDNAPSNAICRKLGFTLLGPSEFEYPPGHFMQCNDWRLDLSSGAEPGS